MKTGIVPRERQELGCSAFLAYSIGSKVGDMVWSRKNKGSRHRTQPFGKMVGRAGFEPATN